MSDYKVEIPDLGEAQDVEVIEICVEIGQRVEMDSALLVIESDKASMEVPSPAAGVVKSIDVELGDLIETGDLVVVLDVEASAAKESEAPPTPTPEPEILRPAQAPPDAPEFESTPRVIVDGAAEQFEIRLPELGDVEDVEVIEVLVAEGDIVSAEQPLVVLESDKATMELPSSVGGRIETLAVAVGDKVSDNSLIAVIKTESSIESDESTAKSPGVIAQETKADPKTHAKTPSRPVSTAAEVKRSKSIYAGPAVRRLARELGVDLAAIQGTGAKSRIVKDDVKLYVKNRLSEAKQEHATQAGIPAVTYPDFSKFGEVSEAPLSRIESRGATNLVRSWLNVVHVTEHDEADVTELEEFRTELNEQAAESEPHLTILPFVLKACATTLHEYPRFNASISPTLDKLILKQYIHLGMAVDTPSGLVVPVIRDVLDKGLKEIAKEIEHLSEAARGSRLTPDEISGASFTVSSLGRLGGTGFTPIVNAPEVGILGVARMATKPVWNGSEFVPRKILPLSLSYDHRAINGAEAGRFMSALAEKLADVRLLIL